METKTLKQADVKSFLHNFLSLGIGTLLYMLVGFIGTPIITRLIDPADYGQMSMLTVYSNIGLMLCGLGLDQTMLRYFYQGDIRYQHKLVMTCCGIPLLAAAGVGTVLLLTYACGLLWIPISQLLLLELNIIALLLNRFTTLVLRLRTHTKTYSLVNLVQKSGYILLTIVLAVTVEGHHFLILAVSTTMSTLMATVLAVLMEKEIWFRSESSIPLPMQNRELLKYGFPIMLSSGVVVLFSALDKLFIRHFGTLADVGVYASAMNLMAVFSIVRTSFNALWMPSAVAHYEQSPEDKEFYQRCNEFISVLMLSFGAVVVLCKDLFVMLLGSKYQAASTVVPYLMFEPILYTISETTATGITVQKKPVYQLVVAGGACLANFFGNWLLVPEFGVQGAAFSTAVSYVVFFSLRTALANRVFYVDYRLPEFFVALTMLFLFAAYGSNHALSCEQFVMFCGVISVILMVYRENIQWLIHYGAAVVKQRITR